MAGELDAGVARARSGRAGSPDVGDQVRGQHDAQPVLGGGVCRSTKKFRLASGSRLANWFVQVQQLRSLGQGQGQGELRALTAG